MTEEYFASTKTSDRYPIWTRANVGEVFPDPDGGMHDVDAAGLDRIGKRLAGEATEPLKQGRCGGS